MDYSAVGTQPESAPGFDVAPAQVANGQKPPSTAGDSAPTPATGRGAHVVALPTDHRHDEGIAKAIELGQRLTSNLAKVVLGTPGTVAAAAIAALSGGHLLVEDVPGVGKTVLARALAVSLGTNLARIQGHADLLPSDVTGVTVFSPATATWEFRPGPVFAHVLLIDELNRTPPRTQSALLETMEEHQVTVDGESHVIPQPHLVIATQNPVTQMGTYPLVESQLDRFALATSVGYPNAETEVRLVLNNGGRSAVDSLSPVCDPNEWQSAQASVARIYVDLSIAHYAVGLCRATRSAPGIRIGASPRAAIWLVRVAQAHAALSGRTYVLPDDVKATTIACLAHRLQSEDGIGGSLHAVKVALEQISAPRP